MKRAVFFSLLVTIFFSCVRKQPVIPEGIIEEKKMTELLTDLHIAQTHLGERKQNKPDATGDEYLELVLEKHKIPREKFLKSLMYYSENPENLNGIYDSVMVRLNAPQK